MQPLTGAHAVTTQLCQQFGVILGNDQVPAIGGAHDSESNCWDQSNRPHYSNLTIDVSGVLQCILDSTEFQRAARLAS